MIASEEQEVQEDGSRMMEEGTGSDRGLSPLGASAGLMRVGAKRLAGYNPLAMAIAAAFFSIGLIALDEVLPLAKADFETWESPRTQN